MAFNRGLVSDGELWMDMVKSRGLTSHTYNTDTANSIYERIQNSYYQAFKSLITQLQNLTS